MKGYKVVNYNLWESLPDIFTTISEAKKARDKWDKKNHSVIEQLNGFRRKIVVR